MFEDTECTNCIKMLERCYADDKKAMKSRCRKILLRFHPDKGGNPEDFKEISNCYNKFFVNEKPHRNECIILSKKYAVKNRLTEEAKNRKDILFEQELQRERDRERIEQERQRQEQERQRQEQERQRQERIEQERQRQRQERIEQERQRQERIEQERQRQEKERRRQEKVIEIEEREKKVREQRNREIQEKEKKRLAVLNLGDILKRKSFRKSFRKLQQTQKSSTSSRKRSALKNILKRKSFRKLQQTQKSSTSSRKRSALKNILKRKSFRKLQKSPTSSRRRSASSSSHKKAGLTILRSLRKNTSRIRKLNIKPKERINIFDKVIKEIPKAVKKRSRKQELQNYRKREERSNLMKDIVKKANERSNRISNVVIRQKSHKRKRSSSVIQRKSHKRKRSSSDSLSKLISKMERMNINDEISKPSQKRRKKIKLNK